MQGGQQPEFHITPSPAKLLTAEYHRHDLLDAVRRTNLIDSPGLLEQNHQLYLTLINGQVRDPQQLSQVVVKMTPAGIPVRIGDVATVERSIKPLYTVVTANGKPAVLLNVTRQPDSNTVDVANEVHAEVERIQQSLPRGIQLQPFYDQSEIVTESIKSVRDAILIGIVLASLIMVLFLRDWGTSIVAAHGDSGDGARDVHCAEAAGSEFQPDDAWADWRPPSDLSSTMRSWWWRMSRCTAMPGRTEWKQSEVRCQKSQFRWLVPPLRRSSCSCRSSQSLA